jgi:hypothetical protein
VYYTGPEERFKHTADEGGPKVIVRCEEERVGHGIIRKNNTVVRAGIPENVLLVDRHYDAL